MRLFLKILFVGIFCFMVWGNVNAALQQPLFTGTHINPEVTRQFHESPWAVATLYDAYCGFITFFVWVCFKERSLVAKVLWFILIMALGNIAMSAYMLIQLFKLKCEEPLTNLVLSRGSTPAA